MTINFIPNDPADTVMRMAAISPAPARPANRNSLSVDKLPPETTYPPGTLNFVAWQAREASFRAIAAFEGILGPLPVWSGVANRRTLPLFPDKGLDINAYYTQQSLEFFHYPYKGQMTYSGASTEIVSHEAGHAILDAIRPELFGVNMMEVAAFHEGFGDCIALMTCLADQPTRKALLVAAPDLLHRNFAESLGEELSAVIKSVEPNSSAAAPRHAYNKLQWTFPETLPTSGKPGVLLNEAHAFGQLVSGVFYDLICAIYADGAKGEAALWDACSAAMKLAAQAAMRAKIQPRFLESWGRTMLAIDQAENGGGHGSRIRAAFLAHGITISATSFLAPRIHLSGGKLNARARGKLPMMPTEARKRLRETLGIAPQAKLETRVVSFGAKSVAEVTDWQAVDLTGLAEGLAGVVAVAPATTLVGQEKAGPAILGAVRGDAGATAEVLSFVATLVERGAIAFDGKVPQRGKGAGFVQRKGAITHVVRSRGGRKVLERVAFACSCGRH